MTTSISSGKPTKPEVALPHKPGRPKPKVRLDKKDSRSPIKAEDRLRGNDAARLRSTHDIMSYVYGCQPRQRIFTFLTAVTIYVVLFSAFYALFAKLYTSSTLAETQSRRTPDPNVYAGYASPSAEQAPLTGTENSESARPGSGTLVSETPVSATPESQTLASEASGATVTDETQQPASDPQATDSDDARAGNTQEALEPEQPRLGDLKIRSNPNGAKVFLDGVEEGVTPLVLRRLPAGEHKVLLKKDGYKPVERKAVCWNNAMTSLKVKMEMTKAKTPTLAEQTQRLLTSLKTAMQEENVGAFVSLLDQSDTAFVRRQREKAENLFSEFDNITESHSSVRVQDNAGDRVVLALHRKMSGTLAETGRSVTFLDADQKFTLTKTGKSQWRIQAID